MRDASDESSLFPPRRYGIGLRTQIMVALGIGFTLSVLLLGLTTARLGSRAVESDRERAARGIARVLLASESSNLDAVLGTGGIVGAEIVDGETSVRRGRRLGSAIEAREGDRVVRLWIDPSDSARRSLPGLIFLYVGVTAAAILLLSYLLLTRSIVRPVEELTRASERIARGRADSRVPVRGAAEVARLAVAFNAMQTQLATERAALEARLAELERTTAELESTERSLVRSEKMASVGRLAAGVAHEIGNPLSAILGLLEIVEAGELPPEEQREFARRAKKETERIHRTIRDLLDFARGEPEPERDASCDLAAVVDDAMRLVAPQKDLRSITLERRIAEDCPAVRGSAPRLSQVVLNLLLNAADAIEGEGVIRIEVHPVDDRRRVELVVADSGSGIAPEVRDHLFEPFVTTKAAGRGTGLGLAVCHTIVEQLGGTIEAGDTPEGGARFTVCLPSAPRGPST